MAPSPTTEELLALLLQEAKAQTSLLQKIEANQKEQDVKLLAQIVGSGKQLDQLERQVYLMGEVLGTLKSQVHRQDSVPLGDADATPPPGPEPRPEDEKLSESRAPASLSSRRCHRRQFLGCLAQAPGTREAHPLWA